MKTSTSPAYSPSAEQRPLAGDLRALGKAGAGVAAAIAIASGVIHGLGKDDETMVGSLHIALGHALPAVAFASATCWLAALWALRRDGGDRGATVPFVVAVTGLLLWASVAVTHALGPYATYQINPAVAIAGMKTTDGLGGAFFATALATFALGTTAFLIGAARRRLVPAPAIALIVLGGLGSFFAGPVGGALLAAGLVWAAVRLRASA